MLRTVVPFAVILLAQFAAQAIAQAPSGDAAAGQKLARAQCSTCHDGEGSPRGQRRGPSLTAVAAMPSTTSLSLHAFLLTPHAKMPNYQLTPQEIDDVVAYILSLRPHRV
jgi:mono/diheme cytochrome c family protein